MLGLCNYKRQKPQKLTNLHEPSGGVTSNPPEIMHGHYEIKAEKGKAYSDHSYAHKIACGYEKDRNNEKPNNAPYGSKKTVRRWRKRVNQSAVPGNRKCGNGKGAQEPWEDKNAQEGQGISKPCPWI